MFRLVILKIIFIFTIVILFSGQMVSAQDYGLKDTASKAGLLDANVVSGQKNLAETVGIIGGAALSLVGIIFFIFIIYGGYQWMVGRGNEEDAKKAIETIFASIIGLIIVLFAYAITTFVFENINFK